MEKTQERKKLCIVDFKYCCGGGGELGKLIKAVIDFVNLAQSNFFCYSINFFLKSINYSDEPPRCPRGDPCNLGFVFKNVQQSPFLIMKSDQLQHLLFQKESAGDFVIMFLPGSVAQKFCGQVLPESVATAPVEYHRRTGTEVYPKCKLASYFLIFFIHFHSHLSTSNFLSSSFFSLDKENAAEKYAILAKANQNIAYKLFDGKFSFLYI